MKVLGAVALFCSTFTVVSVSAEEVLRVVARTESTQLNCKLEQVEEDIQDTPVLVEYTVCDEAQMYAAINRMDEGFEHVLKYEGADEYSRRIHTAGRIRGNRLNNRFTIRIVGVSK